MKTFTAAACALAAMAFSFAAVANEPAHPPATEHCDAHGHGTHADGGHDCEHPKPATH